MHARLRDQRRRPSRVRREGCASLPLSRGGRVSPRGRLGRGLPGELDPGLRFAILGSATLVGRGGELAVLSPGRGPERLSVDSDGTGPAFASNGRHRYWTAAGRLLRDAPSTLGGASTEGIGDVLSGQTRIWAGPTLRPRSLPGVEPVRRIHLRFGASGDQRHASPAAPARAARRRRVRAGRAPGLAAARPPPRRPDGPPVPDVFARRRPGSHGRGHRWRWLLARHASRQVRDPGNAPRSDRRWNRAGSRFATGRYRRRASSLTLSHSSMPPPSCWQERTASTSSDEVRSPL